MKKNFEPLIVKLDLRVNVNRYEKRAGVYFFTQKYFEQQLENQDFLEQLQSSSIIIDEYDWVLFEGNLKQIERLVQSLKKVRKLIGFTGSKLTIKEQNCIMLAFNSEEIFFPSISQIQGDKRLKLEDEMITSNQVDYCKRLFEVCSQQCKLTPIIIVASTNYNMIENHFKKFSSFPFFSMRSVKGTKLEAQFDKQFISKNTDNQYGVYLLTESQGRGTDLKTYNEIEFNGGLYLVVADIYSNRSLDQILGRVGRLQRKGTYKIIIYKQGCKDEFQQVLSLSQQVLENIYHLKLAELLQVLSQNSQPIEDKKQEEPEKLLSPKTSLIVTEIRNSIESRDIRIEQTIESKDQQEGVLSNLENQDDLKTQTDQCNQCKFENQLQENNKANENKQDLEEQYQLDQLPLIRASSENIEILEENLQIMNSDQLIIAKSIENQISQGKIDKQNFIERKLDPSWDKINLRKRVKRENYNNTEVAKKDQHGLRQNKNQTQQESSLKKK